jgi:hypothetical protein
LNGEAQETNLQSPISCDQHQEICVDRINLLPDKPSQKTNEKIRDRRERLAQELRSNLRKRKIKKKSTVKTEGK